MMKQQSTVAGIVNLVDWRWSSLSQQALSVHLTRDKLISRSDKRYVEAEFFIVGVHDKVPKESILLLAYTRISLQLSVG